MRLAALAACLGAAAYGATLAVRAAGGAAPTATAASHEAVPAADAQLRPLPDELRGVHVTMALASLPGKLDEYLSLTKDGLNALELDVKDEAGRVAFTDPSLALARDTGASGSFYDPRAAARAAHARGVYLIGRVVTFEDPVLSQARPELAIRTASGAVWRTNAGLGWTNPYDQRVWKYDVDVAAVAARAGFDEIQFDYVRFPSDGDISTADFPGRRSEPMSATITRFVRYAVSRLRPLHARISIDVFGLSATRDLGIGQAPRQLARVVDAIYPMVYPSHYGAGEYGITDPSAYPRQTVTRALRDFDRALSGSRARLVPWLQDFSLARAYTLADVRSQIAAARSMGVDGFMLWNPYGIYRTTALVARRLTGTELAFEKLGRALPGE